MWEGPITAIIVVVFIVALILIVRNINAGKAEAKRLDAIGEQVANDIRKQNEAG